MRRPRISCARHTRCPVPSPAPPVADRSSQCHVSNQRRAPEVRIDPPATAPVQGPVVGVFQNRSNTSITMGRREERMTGSLRLHCSARRRGVDRSSGGPSLRITPSGVRCGTWCSNRGPGGARPTVNPELRDHVCRVERRARPVPRRWRSRGGVLGGAAVHQRSGCLGRPSPITAPRILAAADVGAPLAGVTEADFHESGAELRSAWPPTASTSPTRVPSKPRRPTGAQPALRPVFLIRRIMPIW